MMTVILTCCWVALGIINVLWFLHAATRGQYGPKTEPNEHPCLPSPRPSSYHHFLERHLPAGQPDSLDHHLWQEFIQTHKFCSRYTQSFLRPTDTEQVLAVCSAAGGRSQEENLCISGRAFRYVTVHLHHHCQVKRVEEEEKHLVLGCDQVEQECRPVHFQGNPNNSLPEEGQPPCIRPITGP